MWQLADRSEVTVDNSKIGLSGTQRGDSKDKDAFVSLGINLVYYFGKLRCPDLSIPK